MIAQAAYAVTLGIPMVERNCVTPGTPLAVVGGGPPIPLDELREWKGDIWAVNGVHDWLLDNGIRSTLFIGDPCPEMAEFCGRTEDAIVCSICHAGVFETLKGKRLRLWHVGGVVDNAALEVNGHCTILSRAPMLGIHMGYASQHYFGASGSYPDVNDNESSVYHKPENHRQHEVVIIRANGQYFRSNFALMEQCSFLKQLFSWAIPEYFVERSGGLLRAMIADDEWEITHVSDLVRDKAVWVENAVAA